MPIVVVARKAFEYQGRTVQPGESCELTPAQALKLSFNKIVALPARSKPHAKPPAAPPPPQRRAPASTRTPSDRARGSRTYKRRDMVPE